MSRAAVVLELTRRDRNATSSLETVRTLAGDAPAAGFEL